MRKTLIFSVLSLMIGCDFSFASDVEILEAGVFFYPSRDGAAVESISLSTMRANGGELILPDYLSNKIGVTRKIDTFKQSREPYGRTESGDILYPTILLILTLEELKACADQISQHESINGKTFAQEIKDADISQGSFCILAHDTSTSEPKDISFLYGRGPFQEASKVSIAYLVMDAEPMTLGEWKTGTCGPYFNSTIEMFMKSEFALLPGFNVYRFKFEVE